jgi:quercetin dioxygenase-like cupin family protein
MKRRLIFYVAILFASVYMQSGFNAFGQDVVKTNPKFTKLLADTSGVRMIKITLAPGEEMVMHTHPVQLLYCLEGGQLTVNYKSGKKETMDLKAGDAAQAPSDPPHTTKNTGTTTLSFLEIEIGSGKK